MSQIIIEKASARMSLDAYIRAMPKVELHVHLEGSIQPETLLQLARRNQKDLPAETVEGLRAWYTFTDFAHFVEIYLTISACICKPDDIELIARDFLKHQAAQNIQYSEVTYTPFTHYSTQHPLSFADQLAALERARQWAATELKLGVGWVLDISRHQRPVEHSLTVADWAVQGSDQGVVALGLGGPEIGNPPENYQEAFARARNAGMPGVPHAGETEGPASIWGAIEALQAVRIGHGVRCLEDPTLVAVLRERQIPLEVCPTSNICLGVFPSFADHPLPHLLAEGLSVTLNSDDPPMFTTTLTDEYLKVAHTFGFGADELEALVINAVRVSLQPAEIRQQREQQFRAEFARLRAEMSL